MWQSFHGRGAGATSSLEDLMRKQRPIPRGIPPQQSYSSQEGAPAYIPSKPGKYQGEKNANNSTPPRISYESVPLEYSPPLSQDQLRPFPVGKPFSMDAPPIGNNSSFRQFDTQTWPEQSGGLIGTEGRGRGRGVLSRGRGPSFQKFSCRVCKVSFDSKQLLNAHLIEKQHFHTQGTEPIPTSFPEPSAKRTYSCRVCNCVFENNNALYAHLKAEGHFNSAPTNVTELYEKEMEPVFSDDFQAPDEPPAQVKSVKKVSKPLFLENEDNVPVQPRVNSPQLFANLKQQPDNENQAATLRVPIVPPSKPSSLPTFTKTSKMVDISGKNGVDDGDAAPVFRSSKFPPKSESSTMVDISGKNGVDDGDAAPVFRSSKFPPKSESSTMVDISGKNGVDDGDAAPVFRSSKFPPKGLTEPRSTAFSEPEDDGDDVHSDGQVVGTCTLMCPEEEILIRLRANEIHPFEKPTEDKSDLKSSEFIELLKSSMIKQYQRSAADHKLAIPHLVRTPRTLYDTMCYIEQYIMCLDQELYDESDGTAAIPEEERSPNSLDVYVFLWNRFRMIAKDFILQNYRFGGRLDEYCIECHERMTRWHIMCNHQLQWSDDYLTSHSYTNNEQLNKLMKTLNELYDEAHLRQERNADVDDPDKPVVPIPNEGEIRSYYVLYQLDNGGEVEKYLQKLHPDALYHPSMQFAIRVVRARRSGNYAAFFRLLRTGNYLQACAMFKYVGFMRLEGLKTMNRVLCAGKQESQIPLVDLTRMLLFEDDQDAEDFVTHCGLEISVSSDGSKCVILNGKNLMDQLPRKKSSKPNQYSSEPELPLVRLMYNHIEGKVIGYSRADISQGHASAAVLFEEFGDEDEGDGEDLEAEDHSGPPVEEDTSVEGEDVSQVTPSLARRVSELSNPITAPVSQSPLESPRHSSVAESIIAMKKSGKSFSSALSKELPTNVVDPFSPKTGTQLPSQIQSPFATSHPETSKQSIEISALPPMNASIRNISPPRAAINQTSDSNFKFSISTIPPAPSPVIEKPLPIDIKPPPTLDPKIESAKALEESQRKLQIQDAARRELLEENRRLKLQQLEHLGAGVQKKVAQRLMKTVFSVWIEGNRAGLAKRRLLIQRLMFMVWRKNYSKIVARSAILNSSLSSIVGNSFMLSPSLSFSRNIRKLNVPSSPRVRSRKFVIPLNLAISGLVGSRSLRWFQQTVCNTIAPTLFYRQTNLLREYLAFPFKFNFSDRSGPLWNRKLLMNIALLSPVTSTSPFWDISSGFVENFVRGLFSVASNSSEFFSSWEMNSECFVKGTSIISRKCHVVITEHLDDTIPLSGLIVLPTGASSETVHRLLLQAAILVEYNVPLVILLIIERTSGSPTSTWAEIHSASENIILSNFLQSLADECQRPISISKAYVVDIYLHSEIINSISNQFNISSGYYRNTMLEIMNCIATCLLDGIQSLCSHVALLPPIRRVDISRWCEERLTDALWSDDPHQCSDEMLVQLFSEMSVALHKCEELISKDSKALESMTFPFQIFQNPEKRVVEDVLYLNMNEHTSDRDACDLPIDWQSASSHSIAMEIIEKFRLPDWTFDGDLIFQWKQFCERLREKGWTLPRDSSHLLTALFEAKTAAADFSQGGKRRRSGEHHNSFIRLEKFYTLFRRWLTLLVQLRAESLSSLETVVYLCVADGSPSADDRQLWNPLKASSIQDTLSNWKSQQLLRLSEEIESEPSIQSEEDHLEPQTLSPTTLGSDSVTSPAPLEIDAGQIYCLSNSVQSEAEKYQLLEKRLLQQVGHEFTENPKQRRRMSHSGHHQGDLIEDYLTKCARERTLFEEYLDIAL